MKRSEMTDVQYRALSTLYHRPCDTPMEQSWPEFLEATFPYSDNSGCIMVSWRGMYIGIETNGYTHS